MYFMLKSVKQVVYCFALVPPNHFAVVARHVSTKLNTRIRDCLIALAVFVFIFIAGGIYRWILCIKNVCAIVVGAQSLNLTVTIK